MTDNYDIYARQDGIHYMRVSRSYTCVCIIYFINGQICIKRFKIPFSNLIFSIPFQYEFFTVKSNLHKKNCN